MNLIKMFFKEFIILLLDTAYNFVKVFVIVCFVLITLSILTEGKIVKIYKPAEVMELLKEERK